jgi:hypothetical protein
MSFEVILLVVVFVIYVGLDAQLAAAVIKKKLN